MMKITVLTENTSAKGLPCEHGLSLYIETKSEIILFDMGQTGLFAENADRLGCNIAAVTKAVISHGHYDHGGGLARFLRLNDHAPVYLSKYAFGPHYNAAEKYIGLDPSLENCDRLVFCEDTTPIGDGMTLFSCAGRKKIIETNPYGLKQKRNGRFVPEDFRHEQYLLIEENNKRILISGCSHRGIINIAQWFDPDVLVGGFHFMKIPTGDTLAGFAKRLDGYKAKYYTCHCTGTEQYEFMLPYIKDLHYISVGDIIDL